jgi:hypothetical protein
MMPGATTFMPSEIAPPLWAADDGRASRHDDEKKCAPGFREEAPPFMSRVQKVGRGRRLEHALPHC